MIGGPASPVWLPEGKGVSHGQARIPVPLSGNGKGRKERKPEGLKACRGEVTLIFPGLHVLELPAPTLAKSFFPLLLTRGAPRALCKEWLGWEGDGSARVVAGAKRVQGTTDSGSHLLHTALALSILGFFFLSFSFLYLILAQRLRRNSFSFFIVVQI